MGRWIKIQAIIVRCDLAGEQSVVEVPRTIKVGRGVGIKKGNVWSGF